MDHVTVDLIAYVMDDLSPAERARVESHLTTCTDCRGQRDVFRRLLEELRGSAPVPPDIHWGRWRAELRARVEGRRARSRWWLRPAPVTLAAGMAAALLAVVWLGDERATRRADTVAVEELVLSDRLDTLDLLEDLDVIRNLDRLAPSLEG